MVSSLSICIRFTFIAVFLVALGGCGVWPLGAKSEPLETGYVIHSFESRITGDERDYAMFVPLEYNSSDKEYPLILFLHGAGERGDTIDLVLKHGPLKEALARRDFEFLVVAPQSPRDLPNAGSIGARWRDLERDVMKILGQVRKKYRVDSSRIYLSGLSMGGFGSFHLAADYPDLFAAVAPICGGGDAGDATKYAKIPFWVFHGLKDRVVPPSRSIEMVELMQALGHDVRLTTYPELGHDSWTVTYENPELYEWFLGHSLPSD